MFESEDLAAADASWQRAIERDRSLSNETIAQEITDLAKDGHGIYGTVLGLLNRLRPPVPEGGGSREEQIARALCVAQGEDPDATLILEGVDILDAMVPRWTRHLATARVVAATLPTAQAFDHAELRQAIARTIIGPRRPVPSHCRWSLEQLQAVQWDRCDTNRRNEADDIAGAIIDRHLQPLLDEAAARRPRADKDEP